MSESELARLLSDVQKLRHGYQLQRWLLAISFVMIALLASMIFGRSTSSVMASTTDKAGILHVRGLVVEDGNQRERLRGHVKTGQRWSLQNRPTESGLGLGCFTPTPPEEASLFSCANSLDRI